MKGKDRGSTDTPKMTFKYTPQIFSYVGHVLAFVGHGAQARPVKGPRLFASTHLISRKVKQNWN